MLITICKIDIESALLLPASEVPWWCGRQSKPHIFSVAPIFGSRAQHLPQSTGRAVAVSLRYWPFLDLIFLDFCEAKTLPALPYFLSGLRVARKLVVSRFKKNVGHETENRK
jgi:hypothetical protein